MEILEIASAILFVKVILCCTLLRNCKPTEKVEKIIVTNDEKICKESTDLTTEPVFKKSAPPKPPRGVKQLIKKSDNLNSQKNISANNVDSETFCNDGYLRSNVYRRAVNCNQCYRISLEKEAGFQEASIQSERNFKDALPVSIKSQEQVPPSEIGIDSSKSVPSTSKVIKVMQFTVVTNSLESRNSQRSQEKTIVNDASTYLNLPKQIYKETKKQVTYPLSSTKIRSKKSPCHKLCKYFVTGLHRIFRLKN